MFRSFLTVSSFTGTNRLLGFVRDSIVASMLGSSDAADAFYAAFRFTNLFFSILGEGSLNAAFVPLFGGRLSSEGKLSALRFAESTQSFMATMTAALVGVMLVSMPWLVFLLTPGFSSNPVKLALATSTLQLAVVYIFFMSVSAIRTAMLNSMGRYLLSGMAALAPNLTMILVLIPLLIGHHAPSPQFLASIQTLGGLMQFVMLVLACRRAGLSLQFRLPRLDPNVRQFLKLLGPVLISGAILQINVYVGSVIGSYFEGAVTYLYYADRVWQLPLGLILPSVAAVFLPKLVKDIKSGREQEAIQTHNRVLSSVQFLALPCSILLAILAKQVVGLLFQRGAFTLADAEATASVLQVVAFAIPAIVSLRIFLPGFIAREDTVTPMKIACVSLVMNAGVAILLSRSIGFIGVPIATTLAAWINSFLAAAILCRKGYYRFDFPQTKRLLWLLFSAVMMALSMVAMNFFLRPLFVNLPPAVENLAELLLFGAGGLTVYLVLTVVTGAINIQEVKTMMKGRSKKV